MVDGSIVETGAVVVVAEVTGVAIVAVLMEFRMSEGVIGAGVTTEAVAVVTAEEGEATSTEGGRETAASTGTGESLATAESGDKSELL